MLRGRTMIAFDFVVFDQLFAYFKRVAVVQCPIGKQKSCNSVIDIQFVQDMENPCVVGIAGRWNSITFPAGVSNSPYSAYFFKLNGGFAMI